MASRRLTAGGRGIGSPPFLPTSPPTSLPTSLPTLRRDAAVEDQHAAGEQLDRFAEQVGDEVRDVARLAQPPVGGVALPLPDQPLALRPLLQQLAVYRAGRDAVDLDVV